MLLHSLKSSTQFTVYICVAKTHTQYSQLSYIRRKLSLGTLAHACNSSSLGGQGTQITRSRDGDHPGHHGETPFPLKNTKKLAGRGVAHVCNPSYSGG